MKRAILTATLCGAIASYAIGQNTPAKKAVMPATKKPATVAAAPKIPPKKTASMPPVSKPTMAATTARTPGKTPPRTTASTRKYYARQQPTRRYGRPATQQSPTADRYREIQDALAAKGYLKTSPSGVWDKDSIDAMTRFQQDQKLEATGKLTAKSLGALGLGPTPASSPSTAGEATPAQ